MIEQKMPDMRNIACSYETNLEKQRVSESFPLVVQEVLKKKRCLPLTPEWTAMRGRLLTASDMASVLGENRYTTIDGLFRRKTGQGRPFRGNDATNWGQKYEKEAAVAYSILFEQELVDEEIGLVVHDYKVDGEHRYGATPDFLTKTGIVVEIKCPYRRRIRHGVPPYYMAQLQMQLEVTGAKLCHFVQYSPPSGGDICDGLIDVTVVERDNEWWHRSLPAFDAFWNSVVLYHRVNKIELGRAIFEQPAPRKRVKKPLKQEEFAIVQT